MIADFRLAHRASTWVTRVEPGARRKTVRRVHGGLHIACWPDFCEVPRFRWLVDDMAKLFDPVLDEESQQRADQSTTLVHEYTAFEQPGTFDIRRRGIRPLSLGAGAHYCLGGALAKLQTEVLFARLFQRFPKLVLAGEPIRRKILAMRGLDSLPVTVSG